MQPRNWEIFFSSVFFVLGFSVVFSLVGVLLQTILSNVAYDAQIWFGRIGGVVIIVFGLYLLRLLKIPFLEREHTFKVRRFKSHYLTSFAFGAAFAVGWTPCVSAALGAILALASTNAGSAFLLLMAYTLGIGIPFLVVGLFTNQAQRFITRAAKWLQSVQYVFGFLLLVLGVLVFAGQLNRIANLQVVADFLGRLGLTTSVGGGIMSLNFINVGIAFVAGLGSFLSPCILPLVPGFLSYLASTAVKKAESPA
ncbi:MAG: sulfite exporter TauE/SafE family protein [Candidatus Liptonbacteria bacterium]|nr:sulfite exporter TauE/SafE family protein [Candidatus Liptonbacteria bacterium]